MLVASMISGVTAGLAGFAARKVLNFTSVQASAAIALIAGLVLQSVCLMMGLFSGGLYLRFYAVMSSGEVIHTPLQMAAVSCLCIGIASLWPRTPLWAWAARLGSMAAMAVLAFLGLQFFYSKELASVRGMRQTTSSKGGNKVVLQK